MASTLKQALSPKAIFIAIGGACLVYAAMIGLTFMKGAPTLQVLEAKMAMQNIAFEEQERAAFDPPSAPEIGHDGVHDNAKHEGDHDDGVTARDLPQTTSSKTNSPLPPAPYKGLIEENAAGFLPVIGNNNLRPFDAYKKPFVIDVKKPSIAIGVKGVGLSGTYKDALAGLIPEVSLILSPYADDLNAVQTYARTQGFETWLELPLETKDFPYSDPGSRGILALAGLKFNQASYRNVLAATSGYAGIAVYSDAAFIDAQPMLNGILSDALVRGLGLVEMNSGRDAMSRSVAITNGASYAAASLKLYDQTFATKFSALKKAAKNDRRAVGIIEVSPAMLAGFEAEIVKAQKEGFEIVPLSAISDKF